MEERLRGLLERCGKNERKAQSELYGMWFAFLMRVVRKYRKNEEDAAAIVNLAFLKIFTNISKYNVAVPFELWIRRIAINTVIDEFRKTRKLDETIVYGDDEGAASSSNVAEAGLDAKDILNLLNRLDEGQRAVFNLFEIDGYSHAEIGVMMGVSDRTSKRYLAAARDNLKSMLTQIHINEQIVIKSAGKGNYLLI